MSLKENTLFGKIDKVSIAIDRIKEFEPSEGYRLAFSGGKDSEVIYDLALKANVKFEAHFFLTSLDPKEVLMFIKEQYPKVIWHKPKMNMWQLILHKGFPPTRVRRYCCEYLKEGRGNKKISDIGTKVVTGVRWEESIRRRNRKIVEVCQKYHTNFILNPIIDWTEKDVWEYIKVFAKIPYCKLYDTGMKRIGCIGCPLSKNQKKELDMFPTIKQAYLNTFSKLPQIRKEKKLEPIRAWGNQTPQEIYNWWIGENIKPIEDKNQITLWYA